MFSQGGGLGLSICVYTVYIFLFIQNPMYLATSLVVENKKGRFAQLILQADHVWDVSIFIISI